MLTMIFYSWKRFHEAILNIIDRIIFRNMGFRIYQYKINYMRTFFRPLNTIKATVSIAWHFCISVYLKY